MNNKNFNILTFSLLGSYFLFQLLFINKVPDIMVDEPWYANTAYNFSKGLGFINTCPGTQGGDTFIVYTFLMGVFYKIFGCSLFTTRLFSIIGGGIGLLGFIYLLRLIKTKTHIIVIASLLFIFSNIYYIAFRSGRPEGWVIVFGIWALYFAYKYTEDNLWKSVVLSSFFGALSFGTHPHGALFFASAAIIFISYSIKKSTIVHVWKFSWVSAVMLAVFIFLFVMAIGDRITEIFGQFSERNTLGNQMSISSNFIGFFKEYTLGIKRLYIFLFEILIIVFAFYYYHRKNFISNSLAICAIFVFCFSILIFNPYPSRHFGEVAIFSLLILAVLLNLSSSLLLKALYIATAIYFLNNLAGDAYIIAKKHNNISYERLSQEIDKTVPDNTIVISLLEFWFPLKENVNYNSYTRWWLTKYGDLNELIDSNTVQYVVMSDLIVKTTTGTSGRVKNVPEKDKQFYESANILTKKMGILIKEIPTENYGNIQIWKIKN